MPDILSPDIMARIHARAFSQSRPWSVAEFSSLLSSPLSFACGDTRCFALVRVVAAEAELLTIATDPDHQRQGHGWNVMNRWQKQAEGRGAEEAFLEVASDNTGAIQLYLNSGFENCGRRANYYRHSDGSEVDAILMRRKFSPS